MRKPTFSVIIPALNEEKFLPKLLESLAGQTDRDFEVIVVDGRSHDRTVAVARGFDKKLPDLTVTVSKIRSLPVQRNLGAAGAKGEWLVFIDADSVVLPYFIDRVRAYITDEHPGFFTAWTRPDSSLTLDSIFTLLTNVYWESTQLIKRPVAPGPLTIMSRTAFDAVGGYDESHAFNEDVDMGLRLDAAGFRFSMLRETLYVWSMRRIRREGKMKVMNQYVVSLLPVLLFRKSLKRMPGYTMGGHLYQKRKPLKRSVIKIYERKLQELMKELFA